MKKLLLAAFAVVTLGGIGSAQAWTTADQCMDITGCSVTVSADSGSTSKQCGGVFANCSCEWMSCHRYSITSGNCNSGWTNMGKTVTGKNCCHDLRTNCYRDDENRFVPTETETQVDSTSTKTDLSDVFGSIELSTAYYGVVNQYNRSPNAGRSNTVNARLDACLGYSNVDSFSDYLSCETACLNNSMNGYCQNSGGAVCIDRCKCKYPNNGTCNGY